MIERQPKLQTESDFQVFYRNGWLVSLAFIQGLACFFFPLFVRMANSGDALTIAVCAALLGIIASQFIVLGFLFALFPAGLMLRLSLVLGLAAVSICVAVFGNQHFGGVITEWLEMYISWVPILLAGWSIPFLAAKAFFGWSLRFDFDNEPIEPGLTVSSLLIGTALVACCLALLNTGSVVRVAPAIAASIICIGCGLVFAIPVTLMVLTEDRLPLIVFKCLAISIGPTVTLLVAYIVNGAGGRNLVWGVIALSCMLMSYCTFMIGVRFLGLRFSVSKRACPQ